MDFQDLINKHKSYIPSISLSEQSRNDMFDDFIEMFNDDLPNKVEVDIDGQSEFVIIDDINNRERVIEDKKMLTLTTTNAKSGSVVTYNGDKWLILLEQDVIDKSHKTFIISKCNYMIKFKYGNQYYSIPSLVINQTSALKYNDYFITPNNKIEWVISANDMVERNTRIIVDGIVYNVSHIDRVSYKNIMILTCQEVVSTADDDLDSGIANNPTADTIIGDNQIGIGRISTYKSILSVAWSLSNNNAQIVSQTDTEIKLKGINIGNVDLIAIDSDGNEYIKTIQIKNMLF